MESKLGAYQPNSLRICFILCSWPFESPKAVVKGYTYVTLVAIALNVTTSPFTKNSRTSLPNPPSTSASKYCPALLCPLIDKERVRKKLLLHFWFIINVHSSNYTSNCFLCKCQKSQFTYHLVYHRQAEP